MTNQFDEYQAQTHLTAAVKGSGRAGIAWASMEFASEWMELGAEVMSTATKSQFRPKGVEHEEYIKRIKGELGDVLWTVSEVASKFGIKLSDVAKENLEKVRTKHKDLAKEKVDAGGSAVPDNARVQSVSGPLPPKPANPFPWAKGNKKAIKQCPACGQATKFEEGCVSCTVPSCGWSGCS